MRIHTHILKFFFFAFLYLCISGIVYDLMAVEWDNWKMGNFLFSFAIMLVTVAQSLHPLIVLLILAIPLSILFARATLAPLRHFVTIHPIPWGLLLIGQIGLYLMLPRCREFFSKCEPGVIEVENGIVFGIHVLVAILFFIAFCYTLATNVNEDVTPAPVVKPAGVNKKK